MARDMSCLPVESLENQPSNRDKTYPLMHVPPTHPRYRPSPTNPSWSDLATIYSLLPAVPVLLWAVSNPWYGVAILVGTGGLRLAFRQLTSRLVDRAERRTILIRFGRFLHITITDPTADGCRPVPECDDEKGPVTCR